MKGNKNLFTELNRLMDEQMEALSKKLTREEAIEYAMRAKRIEELLAVLNPNDVSGVSGPNEQEAASGRIQESKGQSREY